MDKSHVGKESLVSASKCAGSPVQINSIAIDLGCTMGETTQSLTHEHFSILGFTAEMRKRDRKMCLPFASESGDNMNLPQLPVPKFRSWQCSDCLLDILDTESTSGVIVTAKSGAGTSSVHNAGEEKDGLQLVQNIDVGNIKGRNSFPCITTEADQVQTKQITPDNSADKNPCNGPHSPGKASSPSDGNIPFSSVPLRRKPKLRSLADIIREDENSIPAQQIETELDLQARLDAPKKGVAKTLRRRKKIVLEDEEEEETDHPIGTAKRSKEPVIESNDNNTTSRSIENFESESERDDSRLLLFDSQISAKTDQDKVPKQRSLDINRKTRRANTENRTFKPMVNLHKDPPVSSGTSIGDIGLFFKNSLFGEQIHSISDMWKGKRVEEGGYSPYTPPPSDNGSLVVCNNNEKVALDLSLSRYSEKQDCSGRHTEIPDLNESFVEKTCIPEEPQDMLASSGKEGNTVEVEPAGKGKASDDIPMEIVELLAKNQHERSLTDSRKDATQCNNPFKVMSPYVGGISTFTNSSVSNGTMGFLNFPPSKNCDLKLGQFRQFGPLTSDLHRTELHSGPMNMSCSRLSGSADLLWPPMRKNMSFDISQPSVLEDQSCKGKNVKRAATDWSLVSSQPAGSMDAYSNDTIPAMQLLSLMDQRNVSGSSFKLGGPNNFLDRQFSPCSHHPRPMNKNGNPNDQFASSSSFLRQRQSNGTTDFPTLLNGARCSDNFSSKNIFSLGQVPPQKGNSKPVDLAGPSNLLARTWKSNPVSEVCCTLNRNPADFSAPDARNEFMISGEDLKFRKRKRRVGNDPSRRARGNN